MIPRFQTAMLPWDSPSSIDTEPQKAHGRRYDSKSCVFRKGPCVGIATVRSISLLPGMTVSLLVCDHHNGRLMRRAREIEELLKKVA